MALTEHNLQILNNCSRSQSPTTDITREAQIQDAKKWILATLRSLAQMGADGLSYVECADVCIGTGGNVTYRGNVAVDLDDPAFWESRFEDLDSKYRRLERATKGTPSPIRRDSDAQGAQDRKDEYFTSYLRKMESWCTSCENCKANPKIPRAKHPSRSASRGHSPLSNLLSFRQHLRTRYFTAYTVI
ncbi:hypothetical protein O9K51_10863 [Purpureocillium lavendulum]|uniref:Uncharacterized protein n=1 Tax=Purpureocillium lavendulum TaxID=1247861 RepID=A0AB34FCM7_9HYPO|nr:hypothetical protein O9K51_10863 [Purpureocillium lavendulum]